MAEVQYLQERKLSLSEENVHDVFYTPLSSPEKEFYTAPSSPEKEFYTAPSSPPFTSSSSSYAESDIAVYGDTDPPPSSYAESEADVYQDNDPPSSSSPPQDSSLSDNSATDSDSDVAVYGDTDPPSPPQEEEEEELLLQGEEEFLPQEGEENPMMFQDPPPLLPEGHPHILMFEDFPPPPNPQRGAPDEVVDSLPEFISISSDGEEICSICIEEYQVTDIVKMLPCNHYFHTQCIDPWLKEENKICPMCRKDITCLLPEIGHLELDPYHVIPELDDGYDEMPDADDEMPDLEDDDDEDAQEDF